MAQDLLGTHFILRRGGVRSFEPFIFFSLMLSVGVGMIGGGVQHFEDLGERAPFFLSFGLLFSILGFVGRFKPHRHAKEAAGAIGIGNLLAMLTFAAVSPIAVAGIGHGDGHDSHFEAEAEVTVSTPSLKTGGRGQCSRGLRRSWSA